MTPPPLPKPFASLPVTGSQTTSVHVWASDAMEAYAAAAVQEAVAKEREAICMALPGGYSVDPQWVADMIRARKD